MKKKRIVIDISIEEDSKLEENSSLCGLKTKVSFISGRL